MPYVSQEEAGRVERSASATLRWDAILVSRPELGPAVALQKNLLDIVGHLADAIDRGRLPRLSLPPKYLAAKLKSGIPALSGEPIPLPVAILAPSLARFADALEHGGAGESAAHIRAHLDETRMDAGSLLMASVRRDQHAIRTAAVHRGLAPDLLWLLAELATSPFVHALQRLLFGSTRDASLAHALDHWTHGFCPLCGSWPAIAESVGGDRVLRCSFCSLGWTLSTYACIYCGEHGEAFVTAAPVEDRKDRRLELCGSCRSYLKTTDVAVLSPFPLLPVADLETMDLDVVAMELGYARPPLKEFAVRR